ncbi:MAG: OmpA family protein, partial [Dyadobacter sp.]
ADGPGTELPIKAYANFDFVPGDSIIFEDNFVGETAEEIPSLWIPTGGVVEITKINGEPVVGFLDGFYCAMYPRMKKYGYLPQRFSLEFDYLFRANDGGKWKDHGAGGTVEVLFHSDDLDNDSQSLGDYNSALSIENSGQISFKGFSGKYKGASEAAVEGELFDKWTHISIAGTEKGMKVYMNNQRILNAPIQSGKAASFKIGSQGISEEKNGQQLFIRNVRVASGGKDPYKQLTSTVKATYIARGINFDYNKATLRPESMGEINKIIGIMKEHSDLKFEIGGHTDSEGNDAYNLKLSQQRTDAVKAKLVELGIDDSRITTKGFGETKPIASNDTPEGRASNRRVELVRK